MLQSENSDVEHFVDIGSGTLRSNEGEESCDIDGDHVTGTGGHVTKGERVGYHVGHRNPLYCGAEHTCVWELIQVCVCVCVCMCACVRVLSFHMLSYQWTAGCVCSKGMSAKGKR